MTTRSADPPEGHAAQGNPSTGHPPGLSTLFLTEMWERFSYYGMRALLVLFMTHAVEKGGMGFNDKTAGAIYGLYTAMVYLICLPGGWVADRLIGAQRSVWYGGIIIALGHFTLALPYLPTFYLGLLLVVIGTGLLKPNVSAIVGQLYPEGGARRDAGYTIYYMGINLGAAIGPLVCSYLGEKVNWHYGFAAAGVGMVLGLIQYRYMARRLGTAGLHPGHGHATVGGKLDPAWYLVIAGIGIVGLAVALVWSGIWRIDPIPLAQNTTYGIVAIGLVYFAGILWFGHLSTTERKRLVVLMILLMASAMFWSGFEQAGSSLNIFADRFTDREQSWIHFTIPAGWFQSLNPAFIIIFSPVAAALWVGLARRRFDLGLPSKFALGMVLLSLGFLVMAGAAALVQTDGKVLPHWLIFTYLLHTWGELCVSPVGLSAVTKLTPHRFVGQMMGLWFLCTSLGNLIAGLIAGEMTAETGRMSAVFLRVVMTSALTGVVLLCLVKPLRRWIGDVR